MQLLKKGLKWTAIVLGVMFVLGLVIGIVDPEGTKRRAEERKQRNAAKAAATTGKPAKENPPGFTYGFMTGSLYKSKGMKKPTSDDVDAMARRSANENDIPQDKRAAFVDYYTQAFWMGWNRAR